MDGLTFMAFVLVISLAGATLVCCVLLYIKLLDTDEE